MRAGAIEASSKENALQLLQRYGFFVTNLESAENVPFFLRKLKFFERISAKEIALFSRELAIMFGAKVSLVESLRTLSNQLKNQDFKEKIRKISEEVEAGTALSMALSRYPKIFKPFYVAMVHSGEASGRLAESLTYLANHLEKEYYLSSKIKGAMIYPALILTVALAVMLLVTLFVIPNLSRILEESQTELPFVTKLVIGFSKFLRSFGWLLFLAIAGLAVFSFRYNRTKKGKEFFDRLFLNIPFLNSFLKMVYLSRFAENFSTLIAGGISVSQSLEICAEIVDNSVYQKIILEARERVRKGEAISKVLSQFPEEFPPVFTQMTAVGERTGTLDKTLFNLVNFYQQETDREIDSLLKVLEPALIVFLGAAVGGLMGSVLLPLYKISSGV